MSSINGQIIMVMNATFFMDVRNNPASSELTANEIPKAKSKLLNPCSGGVHRTVWAHRHPGSWRSELGQGATA